MSREPGSSRVCATVGNRFKFIKKTQKIEEHRGNRAEDGIVEISYQFEKPRKFDGWWTTYYVSEYPFSSSFDEEKIEYTVDDNTRSCMNMTSTSYSESNEGITVPGSTSHQDFVITSVKELEPEEYKIFIKLTGQHKDTPIRESVTTKKRATCPTCGTSHKNNANFCSHCGTALQIF